MTDFYCNQKFNWAQVSMFDGRVQSCCEAHEDAPSLQQIKSHPVGFFNYPQIIKDRKSMLAGEKIAGCQSCWSAEERGLISRRLRSANTEFLDSVDNAVPQELSIVISNTCAMTCVYCCKKFSHSWRADLVNHGDYSYNNSQRYTVTDRDRVLYRLSQSQLVSTEFYPLIWNQISTVLDSIKVLRISGGEPFLSNDLLNLLNQVKDYNIEVTLNTGLGVSPARLERFIKPLQTIKNLTVWISGENTGDSYEFVRYGNSYENFKNNIDMLVSNGINVKYWCAVSNISIFNFLDFVDAHCQSAQKTFRIDPVSEPSFLAPNIVDDLSKQQFLARLKDYQHCVDTSVLHKSVEIGCSEQDRINSRNFLTEFARRRNLTLDIFPASFVSWLTK
jgi:pyruvate-formate lyase-activating enzyme